MKKKKVVYSLRVLEEEFDFVARAIDNPNNKPIHTPALSKLVCLFSTHILESFPNFGMIHINYLNTKIERL